jgi:hypothetical protein
MAVAVLDFASLRHRVKHAVKVGRWGPDARSIFDGLKAAAVVPAD